MQEESFKDYIIEQKNMIRSSFRIFKI